MKSAVGVTNLICQPYGQESRVSYAVNLSTTQVLFLDLSYYAILSMDITSQSQCAAVWQMSDSTNWCTIN